MQKTRILSDGGITTVEIIEFEGRFWLAPLWIVSPDGKTMRPLRLIGPKFAPGIKPIPGPEILDIFQQMPLPASLLERGVMPAELAPVVEVRENPEIVVPNPDVLN